MLVLSRKEKRDVVIVLPNGDHIVVRTLKIKGSQISLGFEAPENVTILRREVVEEENAQYER